MIWKAFFEFCERKTRLEPADAGVGLWPLADIHVTPATPMSWLPLGGFGVARPGRRLLLSQNDGH